MIRTSWPNVAWLVGVLLLGGCAALERGGEASPKVAGTHAVGGSPEADVTTLAGHGLTLTGLPPWAQRMELDEAASDYEQDPRFANRMRLALLLALADEELRDLDRARELLTTAEVPARHAEDEGLNQLLTMLVAMAQDGQRKGECEPAAQQASEEAIRRDQVRRLETLLTAEREHCRALEEQLNSLKDIDRQMNERERPRALPLDDDDPTQDTFGG
jgi:hypothetical protein